MKRFAVLWLLTCLQLASCSWHDDERSAAKAEFTDIVTTCEFPSIAERRVGAKLRVRGKMTLHAHGILLSDEKCPDVRVHLESTPGGPNINLCDSRELVRKFGCPAGGSDRGPIVTAVGILEAITDPENGFLLVQQLTDFESAADAKRQ
jgi:hypothetical protein